MNVTNVKPLTRKEVEAKERNESKQGYALKSAARQGQLG